MAKFRLGGGNIPLPKPNKGEEQNKFISRCVSFVFDEGTLNGKPVNPKNKADRDRATAACGTQWRNRNKKKEMKVMRHLTAAGWHIPKEMDLSTNAGINVVRSTVLVGDGTYNGEYFPAEEIEKAFLSMDSQPFNLDHSDSVKDEIGFIKNALYDSETKKMSVQPIINGRLSNAKIAKDFIENRIQAGKVAEVSVGVYVTPVEEELADGETRIVCRDLEFDHLALVTRGACGPADGAGIGLSKESNDTDIVEEAKWTTKFINNLPDAAFAYIKPDGEKDDEGKTVPRSNRYLPHHNVNVKSSSENNTVDVSHLRNALARLPQTNLPDAAKAKARTHLIKHAKALGIGNYSEDETMENMKLKIEVDSSELDETIKKLKEAKTMAEDEKEVPEEDVVEEPKPEVKPEVKEEEPKEDEKVEESKNSEIEELKKEMAEMKKQLAKRKTATYSEKDIKLSRRKAGVDFLKQAANKNMRVSWKGGE